MLTLNIYFLTHQTTITKKRAWDLLCFVDQPLAKPVGLINIGNKKKIALLGAVELSFTGAVVLNILWGVEDEKKLK